MFLEKSIRAKQETWYPTTAYSTCTCGTWCVCRKVNTNPWERVLYISKNVLSNILIWFGYLMYNAKYKWGYDVQPRNAFEGEIG